MTTPFRLAIREIAGRFSGNMIEPSLFRPAEIIGAQITGHRSARSVDFTKTYDNPSAEYENPVDYVGQLSADGTAVSGVWSLLDINGTFEMHRDEGLAETAEAETARTVPATGMLF